MSQLVELRNCRRVHDNGRIIALDDVSFSGGARRPDCHRPGPSGSGKSTLLDVLCGLEEPSSGEVLFDGEIVRGRTDWARIRSGADRLRLSVLLSDPVADGGGEYRARHAVAGDFGAIAATGWRNSWNAWALASAVASIRCNCRAERQRVAIARALANRPELIVADEPTGSLDSRSSAAIIDPALEDLQRNNAITVVIVTHDRSIGKPNAATGGSNWSTDGSFPISACLAHAATSGVSA